MADDECAGTGYADVNTGSLFAADGADDADVDIGATFAVEVTAGVVFVFEIWAEHVMVLVLVSVIGTAVRLMTPRLLPIADAIVAEGELVDIAEAPAEEDEVEVMLQFELEVQPGASDGTGVGERAGTLEPVQATESTAGAVEAVEIATGATLAFATGNERGPAARTVWLPAAAKAGGDGEDIVELLETRDAVLLRNEA